GEPLRRRPFPPTRRTLSLHRYNRAECIACVMAFLRTNECHGIRQADEEFFLLSVFFFLRKIVAACRDRRLWFVLAISGAKSPWKTPLCRIPLTLQAVESRPQIPLQELQPPTAR